MSKQIEYTDQIRITLRLPEELHQMIAELARRDLRSLNAEIVTLLRRAIEAEKRGQ